jgi:addiction module HigA family antidote
MKRTVHPGQILFREFMQPTGLSSRTLGVALKVTPTRIGEIVNGQRSITIETALRLSRFFNNTPEFWLDLQRDYDLSKAEKELISAINKQVQPYGQIKKRPLGSGKYSKGNIADTVPSKQARLRALSELTQNQKTIYNFLSRERMHIDMLYRKTKIAAGVLSADLTLMELSGLVKRHEDDFYSIS